ncbi:MAG: alpha/beta hydrolase-fold protein [Pyrinomonadaceae bacterium]
MRILLVIAALLVCWLDCLAQLPSVSSGTLRRVERFPSNFVDPRNIDVWLPAGYSTRRKYAVLYMHDGQMLFDAATTWNKQEWRVDETVGPLIKDRKIREVIVVGIWNNGDYRHSEYYPQKTLNYLPTETRDHITKDSLKNEARADNYLKFLVQELKPYIDKNFSTKKDRDNTLIMGSSMGGLISIYAICEYPNVFGGAAGVSTHLPMVTDPLVPGIEKVPSSFRQYLDRHLPSADTHRVYFDHGDKTLDALYPPLQKMVDDIMRSKGFTSKSWLTRVFPGEDHSETSWAKRLDIPVRFLLGPT